MYLQTAIRILIVVLSFSASIAEAGKPNIILYLSDDLGYADLGFMGHPCAKTPNIDRLAKQGTVFMQHYATGVTCAPSRAGIMTGVHPARYPFYPGHFGTGTQPTVPSVLGASGYATAHFGKWHMGPDESPGTFGYDEVFAKSNNKNDFETDSRDEPMTDQAIDFIQRMAKDDKPFYINIWGHSTHYPIKTYEALIEEMGEISFDRSDFAETIQERFDRSESWDPDLKNSMTQYVADVYGIDKNVGRIMETLDRLGIAENTILVYSSDQGPQNEPRERDYAEHMLGYTGTLRGHKGTQFEGGVRVPFIVRWPGKVKAGRVDHESVTSFMDWLPTLASITESTDLPKQLDGEDISDIWLNGSRDRTTDLYWKTSAPQADVSIRSGKWKFHDTRREGVLLYDLSNDISEQNNVAQHHPELVKTFQAKAKQWESALPTEYRKDKRFGKRNGDVGSLKIPRPQF